MNLLAETITAINEFDHQIDDIVFIGSVEGFSCSWEEFTKLADFEYNNSFGGEVVATDLRILFADGLYMVRGEFDGSEWWSFHLPMTIPDDIKPITSLTGAGFCETLGDCQSTSVKEHLL